MTIITPEQETEDSAEILRGLQEAIGALRREIEGLTEQARSGGGTQGNCGVWQNVQSGGTAGALPESGEHAE
ncbi:hypothetical protein [Sulfitobacter sp. 15WGC]|uniref:hypothetical protein n=1 Tax=Sulfitobacter sp. 15WGC TaxID=2575437 RepID=UPI00200A4D99|nr:hypothetical protein [Sulfitobacter sp. 15WGC]